RARHGNLNFASDPGESPSRQTTDRDRKQPEEPRALGDVRGDDREQRDADRSGKKPRGNSHLRRHVTGTISLRSRLLQRSDWLIIDESSSLSLSETTHPWPPPQIPSGSVRRCPVESGGRFD